MENEILDNNPIHPQPVNSWPISLRFGIIGGAVAVIMFLMMHLSGLNDPSNMGDQSPGRIATSFGVTGLTWALYVLIYFLAVRAYREAAGGYASFGEGFRTAFMSVLVKAGIVLVWMMVFFFLIEPDYFQGMEDGLRDMYENQGMSDAQIDTSLSFAKYFMNPWLSSFMGFINTIIGGTLLSLLAAVIGQRPRPVNS